MIEATVESIRVSIMTNNRVVILKEVSGTRHLPIWIGSYEAEAIALKLQDVQTTRPLPYDLMNTILQELGGTLDHITIAELNEEVFYATLIVSVGGRTVQIDARPSDAIALAVRTGARILVDESVMENAGVALDERETLEGAARDEAAGTEQDLTSSQDSRITGETADDLGIFRDFINSLDLEDFDKGDQGPKG